MRLMKINTRDIWYALYKGRGPYILDENGFETGEQEVLFSDPVKMRCTVAPPRKGLAWLGEFGQQENYDLVIVTDDMDCPIDEYSKLWIDRTPEEGPHDYKVWRVSKYLTHIMYAVRKLGVSDG